MSKANLRNNTKKHRYELLDEGQVVGVAEYELDGETVIFLHTEISEGFEGKGLASRLTKMALDDVLAQGRKIVPRCAFIAGYVSRHPEYATAIKTA